MENKVGERTQKEILETKVWRMRECFSGTPPDFGLRRELWTKRRRRRRRITLPELEKEIEGKREEEEYDLLIGVQFSF